MFYNYHCSNCKFTMDIICATASQQKIDHPSHPHPLQRITKPIVSRCNACFCDHKGTFYQCTTCSGFMIHLNCALLPAQLQIQRFTDNTFSHSHLLTLAYSFPYDEQKSKFFPRCKVCAERFYYFKWIYKCDKCRYYVHADCVTSKKEPFMSILMSAGLGKIYKNFKDEDHPNLLKCPFPDESCGLIKHHFINHEEFFMEGNNERMLNHESHPHQLIRFDTHSSLREKSVSLHDPMKRSQLLCDGCVKPVTTLPFYKCSRSCDFVLHEWCVRLPSKIQNHPFHPNHTLVLLPKHRWTLADVFSCDICSLPSNGFVYICPRCYFRIDINCAFIPEKITHEAHPNHLLSRMDASVNKADRYCKACRYNFDKSMGFHCRSCDFYLHTRCALLLPSEIIHKFNKHPLTLRYEPVENHLSEYFCEICEEQMWERQWFYHCTTCAESMHTACAPIKHECKQAIIRKYMMPVFDFINVKFGGTHEIGSHPHRVSFIQGTTYHGCCARCGEMIFKCLECKFAIHYMCVVGWGKRIWN
ncbi:zinc finger, PHD-type [Artemisia annua]|uniref:Zinc finger, PHD-type n=1 Tax=Artemisia annua TaxID=35608 RepID=A0A2U1PU16_ARTAN|nr:zinc finger, PHD-type [Artemisia annua]